MTRDAADRFAALHHGAQPFLLPNAWDVASAAALVSAGFPAVGTTSLGVAAASGLPDARGTTRPETVTLARRLGRLGCLFSVDIESGFGGAPGEVADLVVELAGAGAVGINIEDGRPDGTLAPIPRQQQLIAAIADRTPHVFINARTDTHWLAGEEPPAIDDTNARATAYVAAGADGVFVPGLTAPGDIETVVSAVNAPINVLYSPGQHTVADLARLGVQRISTGSLLFRAALHATVETARAVASGGRISEDIPGYADVLALLG